MKLKTSIRKIIWGLFFGALVLYLLGSFFLGRAIIGTQIYRASVSSDEFEGNNSSTFPDISDDGRYIVFTSSATNLVAGDTNGAADIFLRDTVLGTTERISVDSDENESNGNSGYAYITPDGRYVVFESFATNLVPGDTNGRFDIFLRDRISGTTELVSLSDGEALGNFNSQRGHVSDDGRYVVFQSASTNLVPADTNTKTDIFLRDRTLGTTTLVSVDSDEVHSTSGGSSNPKITGDGRYVIFDSINSALTAGDTNAAFDIFLRDTVLGTTEMISLDSLGGASNGGSLIPQISDDGRYVVFASTATDLVDGDVNGVQDVFVRDRTLGTTTLISVDSNEVQGDALSGNYASGISGDGRYILFESTATNLVADDTNGVSDVFLRDTVLGTTILVSTNSGGEQITGFVTTPAISSDGSYAAFGTTSSNLVEGDTNGQSDIFYLGLPSIESGGGSSVGVSYVVPPVCSFSSDINSIEEGGTVSLAWSAHFAEEYYSSFYYRLSDNKSGVAWYEGVFPENSTGIEIADLTESTSFQLAAINMWGASICNLDISITNPEEEMENQNRSEGDSVVDKDDQPNESDRDIDQVQEAEDLVSGSSPLECPVYLTEYIHVDHLNNPREVIKLEQFLNQFEGESLIVDGFYDKKDFQAVVRFQEKYREEVLDPWKVIRGGQGYDYLPSVFSGFVKKLSRGTGYVYISTTKQINYLYCQHFYAGEVDS